jgi:AGCS family alanine or glycine:cation symporter
MDQLTAIVQAINSYLWGVTGLIPLLVGVGIFYTFKLKFVQIRKFGQAMRFTFRGLSLHGERAGKEGMTSFQSLATAVAAQVGTGNIAGAATAIAMGGPGAIFWMWIAAFFGMATIFAEAVLAQLFKTKDDKGHVTGGPAYYITNGLHCRPLAIFFSISIIIALGFIGNMVQSNSIAVAFQNAFGIPSLYTGLFVAGFAAFIFFGGLGRIASTTEKIVPVMAFLYILGSLIVILSNYEQIIPAFKMIFVGAFNPQAATGGVIGATIKEAMRYGVARGLFSNEAGLGSTPHAPRCRKGSVPCPAGPRGHCRPVHRYVRGTEHDRFRHLHHRRSRRQDHRHRTRPEGLRQRLRLFRSRLRRHLPLLLRLLHHCRLVLLRRTEREVPLWHKGHHLFPYRRHVLPLPRIHAPCDPRLGTG